MATKTGAVANAERRVSWTTWLSRWRAAIPERRARLEPRSARVRVQVPEVRNHVDHLRQRELFDHGRHLLRGIARALAIAEREQLPQQVGRRPSGKRRNLVRTHELGRVTRGAGHGFSAV